MADVGDAGDHDTFLAIMRAAAVFSGSHFRRALEDGITAPLIARLRTGEPLAGEDLQLLADLLSGNLSRKAKGQPRLTFQQRRDDDTLAADIRIRKHELMRLGAIASVAETNAAEEYLSDPRLRRKPERDPLETLINLARRDPYQALLNDWLRAMAKGVPLEFAALNASLNHRAILGNKRGDEALTDDERQQLAAKVRADLERRMPPKDLVPD